MKFRRWIAIGVAVLVAAVIPCTAFATLREESEIIPKYSHAIQVNAELEISNSGLAKCMGSVTLKSATSDVSVVLTLYKKNGTSWQKVTSWSQSSSGKARFELTKTKTVAHGTYKVVLTGTVTTANGDTERISDTSGQITY